MRIKIDQSIITPVRSSKKTVTEGEKIYESKKKIEGMNNHKEPGWQVTLQPCRCADR